MPPGRMRARLVGCITSSLAAILPGRKRLVSPRISVRTEDRVCRTRNSADRESDGCQRDARERGAPRARCHHGHSRHHRYAHSRQLHRFGSMAVSVSDCFLGRRQMHRTLCYCTAICYAATLLCSARTWRACSIAMAEFETLFAQCLTFLALQIRCRSKSRRRRPSCPRCAARDRGSRTTAMTKVPLPRLRPLRFLAVMRMMRANDRQEKRG